MHERIRSAHMHVIRKTGATRRPRLFNAGSFSGLLCVRLRGGYGGGGGDDERRLSDPRAFESPRG